VRMDTYRRKVKRDDGKERGGGTEQVPQRAGNKREERERETSGRDLQGKTKRYAPLDRPSEPGQGVLKTPSFPS
jgi:hypothetical protein